MGCDVLGAYDTLLRKHVNSRKPPNEVVRLEGRDIDVSSLTFVDDLTDMLIESIPRAMNLREPTTDKTITKERGRVGCRLEPSKEESLPRLMGQAPERIWSNVVRQSDISDVDWK